MNKLVVLLGLFLGSVFGLSTVKADDGEGRLRALLLGRVNFFAIQEELKQVREPEQRVEEALALASLSIFSRQHDKATRYLEKAETFLAVSEDSKLHSIYFELTAQLAENINDYDGLKAAYKGLGIDSASRSYLVEFRRRADIAKPTLLHEM